MLNKLFGTKPTTLWTNGSSSLNTAISEDVLNIARSQFGEDAEIALFNNEEIRTATYAVVQALPARLQKKVTDEAFLDIAAILLLQRASEGYKIGLATGNGAVE